MKREYYSIIFDFPNYVVTSQVIEYLEMLQKENMNFNLVFFLRWGTYLKRYKEINSKKREFSNKLNGKISFYPVSRKSPKITLFISYLVLFLRFRFSSATQIVLHCRGTSSAYTASLLKKTMSKIKYVYDIRGDIAAEYEYNASKKGIKQNIISKWLEKDIRVQKKISQNADKIICISKKLRQNIVDKYGFDEEKIEIFPCLANGDKFLFNNEVREKIRKKLKVENKFVLIYAGSLGPWHFCDKMFQVINNIIKNYPNIMFIVLTPDVETAKNKTLPNYRETHYLIKNVDKYEVSKYLIASDLGILFREKHPLNEVAAPTKFAEYLLSGLKVMITSSLYDYSEYVKQNNYGIVINDENNLSEYLSSFNDFYTNNHQNNRYEISKKAYIDFSKESKIPSLHKLYRTL